ncbi:hypothetical protein CSKR_201594 [Clonorchis sinensis]|uniref:Uncharacterized protein n=1 Tax=Clonorchis sinensis TaxID=79923 RepID=A0A8T1MRW6_CLOSI|nr:hypothetical protein CSKR_201594 [Clonorchis sinensis]
MDRLNTPNCGQPGNSYQWNCQNKRDYLSPSKLGGPIATCAQIDKSSKNLRIRSKSLLLVEHFEGARIDDARASNKLPASNSDMVVEFSGTKTKGLNLEEKEADGLITPTDPSCRIQKRLGDTVAKATWADKTQEPWCYTVAIMLVRNGGKQSD